MEENKENKEETVKYCLYARKSTESDEKQALSIDSQIKEMLQLAKRDNLFVAEIRKESHSAKATGQRPVFNELLEDIKSGKFTGILSWAPDRLSRNAGDLGAIVDLMDQKLLREVRTYGQTFTDNPNEKFLLMILCSQAKLENDNKGVNVKRGLRARCEQGLWPSEAPTGYFNDKSRDKKCHVVIDPKRAPVIKQMFEKVAYENCSGRKVFYWLRDEANFKTRGGKHLTLGNIYRILGRPFYHGAFEYPENSGNWYQGKHTPIIDKNLFDLVQSRIHIERKFKYRSKEFAFTQLMKCGLCGSGVSAEEKFKKLKDGNTNRYIYYGCSRSRDHKCKCGYIREENLIEQIAGIIDKIDLSQLDMRKRIEKEIERYNHFQAGVLGRKDTIKQKVKDVDIRNYAKYLLREGNIIEKRELLGCLKSKLILKNKKLSLQ